MSWEVGPEIQKIILVGAVMVEREKNFDGERRGKKSQGQRTYVCLDSGRFRAVI